jgi:hypothetical protein
MSKRTRAANLSPAVYVHEIETRRRARLRVRFVTSIMHCCGRGDVNIRPSFPQAGSRFGLPGKTEVTSLAHVGAGSGAARSSRCWIAQGTEI